MQLTTLIFLLLSVMAVGSAVMMLLSKNPVHSILWVILVFFAISGHYVVLNAQFLAVVNIIVYAGAILVLFLFVVMMMNLNKDNEPVKNYRMQLLGVLSGGGLMLLLVATVMSLEQSAPVQVKIGDAGLITTLGKTLFNHYVLPFEISSVLFLSAIVGAVITGKREKVIIAGDGDAGQNINDQ